MVPSTEIVGVLSLVMESPCVPESLEASRETELGGVAASGNVYLIMTVPLAPAIPEVLPAVL
jgi:hypothetical protein